MPTVFPVGIFYARILTILIQLRKILISIAYFTYSELRKIPRKMSINTY